jgi:hypothetical protein
MPIAPDRYSIDDGYIAPAPKPAPNAQTIEQLQAAAATAAYNASQNLGNGPDAKYDQKQAKLASDALQAALAEKAAIDAANAAKQATPTPPKLPTTPPDITPPPVAKQPPIVQQPPIIVDPTPPTPPPPPALPVNPIKTATPQYIVFNDDEVPVDAMVDLLFENIGGQELLSIARADTVNGNKILYQPIKNLNILKQQYNPNNIIRLQNTSDKFFSNFSIKLSDKIPNIGNGSNGTNVYLNSNGDLVIELINIASDEQVEIEIGSSGIIAEVGI